MSRLAFPHSASLIVSRRLAGFRAPNADQNGFSHVFSSLSDCLAGPGILLISRTATAGVSASLSKISGGVGVDGFGDVGVRVERW